LDSGDKATDWDDDRQPETVGIPPFRRNVASLATRRNWYRGGRNNSLPDDGRGGVL